MTSNSSNRPNQPSLEKSLPTSIVSGILGLVVGGGLTFLGLQYLGYSSEQTLSGAASASSSPPQSTSGGMGGGMMGGGGGMMGGGGGMMGGGGGMMGGGNAPRGKRNLTTLVAKLDLASKGIAFQLNQQQSSTLAEQLALLEQPEKMTQDEAQERCDALEAILDDGQKETLASFEMPRGARGGGGGGGGGGPAGPPGGGEPDESNPFQDETNQARLRSLLERLQVTDGEKEVAN